MPKEQTAVKKKPHFVLGLVIIVLLIPLMIVAAVLLSTLEDSSKPVIGHRYQNELDPAITDEQIAQLKESLVFEGTDNVQVNFKSARVAILIDVNDTMGSDGINKILSQAYDKVNAVLPIETYFTNHTVNDTNVKMYDLQIDVYNVIEGDNQIHVILNKTGAQEKPLTQIVSTPKNPEVSESVQNQNKGE